MVQRLKEIQHRLCSWWQSRPKWEDRPIPEEDPIVNSSLALPIAVSSLLLMMSLLWALYEEGWGLRPWKNYQREFVQLYREALINLQPIRAREEKAVLASPDYKKLLKQAQQAEEKIGPQLREIEEDERKLSVKLTTITKPFTNARSRIQAKIYEVETAVGGKKEALQKELQELKEGPYEVQVLEESTGARIQKQYTFDELEEEFGKLKTEQGKLQTLKIGLLGTPTRLRRELEAYKKMRLTGLTPAQMEGLLERSDNFQVEIKQIHNAEMNLVDRCESCHLASREPVVLTAAEMGEKPIFASHPNRMLLDIHDPEVFGCSPCHNGNGVGTTSITKAHGRYKHWLWPLYAPENFEAGCLQCHEADRHLELASVLNAGKELFHHHSCWGCHSREGFDTEPRALRDTQKAVVDLETRREETQFQKARAEEQGDRSESNEEASRLYAEAIALTLSEADIDAQLDRLRSQVSELMMEVKRPGPNLKEVRLKLRKEWVPIWIQNPHSFRSTTKMPRFRLGDDQHKAISAFIWQSGIPADLPRQAAGDPDEGKDLFETRGCMACHSIGEGDEESGGTFAANLSRVGEKANYDYLVRWIHNPRERTLPYCPIHKRDITPQDYASQGLEFEFDLENDQCPLGDHVLQTQQATVMPSLRLTWEDARHLASYLVTLKEANAVYPSVSYLDDPALFEAGRFWVRHYGCFGCHEIASLEEEGKIGTDLTKEGSKPIERLDFALLTQEAKKKGWYNHKGFFEHKLADPAIFDQGRIREPLERLRMPEFDFSEEKIDQLTTFLLGSAASIIPESFFHRPSDQRQDIQAGWWVVMKYNCVACHQFTPVQKTVLEDLAQYQGVDGKEKLPPSLVGQGARANPSWLSRFLKNPALSKTDLNRNGARPYLEVRMPSFNLSDGEVQKLVRFFQALSKQPLPYLPPQLEPLTNRELTLARELFTHQAAPCLRCHATGDPVTDRTATAPNFQLVPERLKPDWTERWIVHPEIIRPGTAMPSDLFRWDGKRWIFALAELESFKDYDKDHADLVVRYMFQFSKGEQRQLKRTGRVSAVGFGQSLAAQ